MPLEDEARLAETLAASLSHAFGGDVPDRIGIAVSGGGDSMALLDLLVRWGQSQVHVVSVNHGLRAAAADELALVARYCTAKGLSHEILQWQWNGSGSVQTAAREARRFLIGDWARAHGVSHVALGHTEDDQAETVLMRLARGSGVDGLAAMREASVQGGICWLRPVLGVRREALRVHLRRVGQQWADDPSNEDPRYDRVKVRKVLDALAPLGLSVERLSQTAQHMARARDALDEGLAQLIADVVTQDAGDLVLDRDGLAAAPEELRLRLVSCALGWVSGQTYRPRFKALQAAMQAQVPHALQGCLLIPHKTSLTITREWAAVAQARCSLNDVWDARWRVSGPVGDVVDGEIAALGEDGLAQIPEWRDTGRRRQALLASPAVWGREGLIAAPLAQARGPWQVHLVPERVRFPD